NRSDRLKSMNTNTALMRRDRTAASASPRWIANTMMPQELSDDSFWLRPPRWVTAEPVDLANPEPDSILPPPAAAEPARASEVQSVIGSLMTRHLSPGGGSPGQLLPLNRLGLDSLSLLHFAAAIDLE